MWRLADCDQDGLLDSDEFALAMHLINVKVQSNISVKVSVPNSTVQYTTAVYRLQFPIVHYTTAVHRLQVPIVQYTVLMQCTGFRSQ